MKKLLIFTLFISFLIPIGVIAEEGGSLPEPMVGQATVSQSFAQNPETSDPTMVYYGTTTGNETVYNYEAPGKKIETSFGPSLFLNQKNTTADTYIDVVNNNAEEFNLGMTSAFWLNFTSGTDKQTIFSVQTTNGLLDLGIEGGSGLGGKRKLYLNTCGNASCNTKSDTAFDFNTWGFYVITYLPNATGNKDGIVLYSVDRSGVVRQIGYKQLTVNKSVGELGDRFNIGRIFNGANYYKGGLDEFKIFNKVVDQADFPKIMNGSYTDGLADHWDFSGETTRVQDMAESSDSNGLIQNLNYEYSDNAPRIEIESGVELFGFDQNNLIKCVNGIIIGKTPDPCFIKNSPTTAVRVMTSRTYYNDMPGMEVATLLYSSQNMIIGDSYLGGRSLSDFSYWGKHLATSGGAADTDEPMWGIGGYVINKDAQASLDTTGYEYLKYMEKINVLRGEATLLDNSWGDTYYLQHNTFNAAGIDQSSKYPEGKTWKYGGDLTFHASNYVGTGTVIIYNPDPNYTASLVLSGDIQGAGDADMLGLIVFGDVVIPNNVKIKASIFATGTITVGSNVEMIGSFVANDFSFPIKEANIRMRYDNRLSNKMPPGFGYLNMPRPE